MGLPAQLWLVWSLQVHRPRGCPRSSGRPAPHDGSIFIHVGATVVVRQLRHQGVYQITVSDVSKTSSYLNLERGVDSTPTSGLAETSGALALLEASNIAPKPGMLIFQTQWGMRASLLSISAASYCARARSLKLTVREMDASKAGRLAHLADVPPLHLSSLFGSYGGGIQRRQLRINASTGTFTYTANPPLTSVYTSPSP